MRRRLGRLIGASSTGCEDAIVLISMIVLGGSTTSSCSRDLAPTVPTSGAVVGTPAPGQPGVTLKGRVTETAPTTVMGIWDATVTLTDGVTSWSSARTEGGAARGVYTISGLHPGRYDAVATADGYVAVTRAITISADTTTDFALPPVPEATSHTFEYQISDGDGSCSDGTQSRPCRIVAIPIHNGGPIDATLRWTAAGPVTLNVTLFQSGQPTPLARSTAVDGTSQRLSLRLAGGAVYELRITYVSGTGTAAYTMRVNHQN